MGEVYMGKLILTARGLNSETGQKIIRKCLTEEGEREKKTILLISIKEYRIDEILKQASIELGFTDEHIVVAKYAGARGDAPRMISLDEAFAGVDEMNIRDMFRLMVEFDFNFMINSQILWGDYETVPALAIYQLVRPENAKFVTVIRYTWNGRGRQMTMKKDVNQTE